MTQSISALSPVVGTSDPDYLIASGPSDTLQGGAGNDTYIIDWSVLKTASTNPIVEISDSSGTLDTLLVYGRSAAQARLTYLEAVESRPAGWYLRLVAGERPDSSIDRFVRLVGYDPAVPNSGGIERIRFITADGSNTVITDWTRDDLATSGRTGTDGNDRLVGRPVADTLEGGAGNDLLEGRGGGDTYVHVAGEGDDVIDDGGSAGSDVLRIRLTGDQDVAFSWIRDEGISDLRLHVQVLEAGKVISSVRLDEFLYSQSATTTEGIERLEIVAADGTVRSFDRTEIFARAGFYGTDFNEVLTGFAGADTLAGRGGNDRLDGAGGGDVYEYRWFNSKANDGADIISDSGSTGEDVLRIYGLDPTRLRYVVGSDNDLSLRIVDTAGFDSAETGFANAIRIERRDPADPRSYSLEKVEFYTHDGRALGTLTLADVLFLAGTAASGNAASADPAAPVFPAAPSPKAKPVDPAAPGVVIGKTGNDDLKAGAAGALGLAGSDTITGGDGDDVISGGVGNDSLVGGGGFNTLDYSQSDRAVRVSLAQSTQSGGDAQGDTIAGFNGIIGSATQNDSLTGATGNDELQGLGGNDVLKGGAGSDSLFGGTGIDDLWGEDGNDILVGGADNDSLKGHLGDDTAYGGDGADYFLGAEGNDVLVGGSGNDTFYGGDGNDLLSGEDDGDLMYGDDGNDTVYGGAGADTIDGVGGNDVLFGGGDNDTVRGGAGNDTIWGGGGNDSIDGGVGIDMVDGSAALGRLRIDLGANRVTGDAAAGVGTDTINNFEDATGSAFSDVVLGNGLANTLRGNAGDDTLEGAAGDDTLLGGAGNDVLIGGTGSDQLDGEAGSDTYFFNYSSSGAADTIRDTGTATGDRDVLNVFGIAASDLRIRMIGGQAALVRKEAGAWATPIVTLANTDLFAESGTGLEEIRITKDYEPGSVTTVWTRTEMRSSLYDFSDETTAVSASGSSLRERMDGGSGNDVLNGLAGNDTLVGNAGSDSLDGGAGDDSLLGGIGNDTLLGGVGADVLEGGAGNDELKGGAGADVYQLNRADGLDVLSDDGADGATDVLVLRDVASSEARVAFRNGVMTVKVRDAQGGWSDVVRLSESNLSADVGAGIEQIRFSDGVVWNRAQMRASQFDVSMETEGVSLTGYALDDVMRGGKGADTFDGADGRDEIYGGDDADLLSGGRGDDTVFGGTGQDRLEGGDGNDRLSGDAGNDRVYGGAGNDVLIADSGSDTLDGGAGADSYEIRTIGNTGSKVVISDEEGAEIDTVSFLDLSESEVRLSVVGADLLVEYKGTVIAQIGMNLRSNGPEGIDRVVFKSSTLTREMVRERFTVPTYENEYPGTAGPETIRGSDAGDVLNGKGGNDRLEGGLGSDDYIHTGGLDGNDTIGEADVAGFDRLLLEGIRSDRVQLARSGNDLLVKVLDEMNGQPTSTVLSTITVAGMYSGGLAGIEAIRFDDGVSWDRDAILRKLRETGGLSGLIDGTTGNDLIVGSAGRDTLVGRSGFDMLDGGAGNDVILFDTRVHSGAPGSGESTYIFDSGSDTGDVFDLSSYSSRNFDPVYHLYFTNARGIGMWVTASDGTRKFFYIDSDIFADRSGGIDEIRFSDLIVNRTGVSTNPNIRAVTLESFFGANPGARYRTDATENADTVMGSERSETISGLGGADVIFGGNGNDLISGETMNGGFGDDTLIGETGAAGTGRFFVGAQGNDSLRGGDGNDTYLYMTGEGFDTITDLGTSGLDVLEIRRSGQGTILPENITGRRVGDDIHLEFSLPSIGRVGGVVLTGQAAGQGIEQLRIVSTTGTVVWGRNELALFGDSLLPGTDAGEVIYGDREADPAAAMAALYGGNDTIDALGGNDSVYAAGGNDEVRGGSGNDLVYGGFGNDTLFGGTGSDEVYGGAGDDVIRGGAATTEADAATDAGNDTLFGGLGNDTLVGGRGATTYVYELGDGNDVILREDNDSYDVLHLKGITRGQVTIIRNGTDVVLQVLVNGSLRGTVTLQGQAGDTPTGNGRGIERITFDDPSSTPIEKIDLVVPLTNGDDRPNDLVLTPAADPFRAGGGNDTIDGLGGNDTIYGEDGDDILIGGSGTDSLFGGAGNDTLGATAGEFEPDRFDGGTGDDLSRGAQGGQTYVYRAGDGNDTILDVGTSGTDRLLLSGFTAANLSFVRGPGAEDLTLRLTDASGVQVGSIVLKGQVGFLLGQNFGIEEFVLDSGVWTGAREAMRRAALVATDEADRITGSAVNDQLIGRGGDDTLVAGGGQDTAEGGFGNDLLEGGSSVITYRYGLGDGHDVVRFTGGGISTLVFTDIVRQQLVVLKNGNDYRLEITSPYDRSLVLGSISLSGTFRNGSPVEQVIFAGAASPVAFSTLGIDGSSGTPNNDTLTAPIGGGSVFGREGNDTITGGTGNDVLEGGVGNDLYIIKVDGGDDVIRDANGDALDTLRIVGIDPSRITFTGAYSTDDHITLGVGSGTIRIEDFRTKETIDRIEVVDAKGVVTATWDREDILSRWTAASFTSGGDTRNGTSRGDVFNAGGGDDVVYGLGGNDRLDGGANDDALYGGDDADELIGGTGGDKLFGGAGDDRLFGGDDADILFGGAGRDSLTGGAGADIFMLEGVDGANPTTVLDFDTGDRLGVSASMFTTPEAAFAAIVFDRMQDGRQVFRLEVGGQTVAWIHSTRALTMDDIRLTGGATASVEPTQGDDLLSGGDKGDFYFARMGNDTVYGEGGNDTLNGAIGNDQVFGGEGDDILDGGYGMDKLYGGDGNDRLISTFDNQTMFGGEGNDTFEFDARTSRLTVIEDFALGERLLFTMVAGSPKDPQSAASWTTSVDAAGTYFEFTQGNFTLRVKQNGFTLDQLVAAAAQTPAGATRNGSLRDDPLVGTQGDDYFLPWAGNDTLSGGAGKDVFDFSQNIQSWSQSVRRDERLVAAFGQDVIEDFDFYDVIRFGGGFVKDAADLRSKATVNEGGGVLITVDSLARASILLRGDAMRVTNEAELDRFLEDYAGSFDYVQGVTRIFVNDLEVISGTEGQDSIRARDGSMLIRAGAGNDTITSAYPTFSTGNGVFYGEDGDDFINGKTGEDQLFGGSGNDRMDAGTGNDALDGGTGDDSLFGGSGNDRLEGQEGNDRLSGGLDQDTILGGAGNDSISGDEGIDLLYGGLGNDLVNGDSGNDTLYGEDGDDNLFGGGEHDFVDGGLGNDTVSGGLGNDTLLGQGGNDFVYGNDGDDSLDGGLGNDWLDGSIGNDTLLGGAGNDTLSGKFGNDRLEGGDGNDSLTGEQDQDILIGGAGNDTLVGGDGNDVLEGGLGSDVLSGTTGQDTFVFHRSHTGRDTINGFSTTAGTELDRLELHGFTQSEWNAAVSNLTGNRVVLVADNLGTTTFDETLSITFTGLTEAQIRAIVVDYR